MLVTEIVREIVSRSAPPPRPVVPAVVRESTRREQYTPPPTPSVESLVKDALAGIDPAADATRESGRAAAAYPRTVDELVADALRKMPADDRA